MQRFDTHDLPSAWRSCIEAYRAEPEGVRLWAGLRAAFEQRQVIYPPDPWRALRTLAPEQVRVVIFGQDPYHGPGQAMGMAFSVPESCTRLPPSLRNIFKELSDEFQAPMRTNGDLSDWAAQGVLLLNSVLTVQDGQAGSHAKLGWQALTDRLLLQVLRAARPCVYMLWGAWAQQKADFIDQQARAPVLVLKSNHPSPLSARRAPVPFFGCGHFAAANVWLQSQGVGAVKWLDGQVSSQRSQGELF